MLKIPEGLREEGRIVEVEEVSIVNIPRGVAGTEENGLAAQVDALFYA